MEVDKQLCVEKFSAQLLLDIKKFHNQEVINTLQQTNLHQVTDNSGLTLLHYASDWGNNIVVLQLIQMGADVNAQDQHGRTPLMLTLRKNRLMTMKILLEAGADVHITNSKSRSSLKMVMSKSSTDDSIVKMFFKKVKSESKNTKELAWILFNASCHLHHMIYLNKPQVARYLLEFGCPIDCRDAKEYSTPLHIAVQESNLEFVKLLLEYGADVDEPNNFFERPINCYCTGDSSDDNVNILKLLLSKKPEVYECNRLGDTGMSDILGYGEPRVVSMFLRHGMNLSEKDYKGNTALHYVAHNSSIVDFDELLQGIEFDVNISDNEGRTPLHVAANFRKQIAVDFLLKNGANVNAKDKKNHTPFYHAVHAATSSYVSEDEMTRNRECVELLLQNGADMESDGDETRTVVGLISSSFNKTLFMPVLMHLAIREALGSPIAKRILDQIDSDGKFKEHFQLYRCEIKQMQTLTVYGSVTLFKLLAEGERKIVRYLRNPDVVERLELMSNRCISKSYCFEQLQRRVQKFIRTAELRQQAAVAISRMAKLNEGLYGIILDQIFDYLSDRDMKNLLNA